MTTRFKLAAATLAAALVLGACDNATKPTAVAGSGGSSDDTQCVGTLTGAHDNVVVPPEAVCFLINATVRGNVKALRGSQLFAFNNTVRGNVEGDKADAVQWNGGSVGGTIHIVGFPEADPFFVQAISNATILPGGNIQVEKLSVGGIQLLNNNLQKGNIKVEDNNLQFPMLIIGNTVAENIQVFKNRGPGVKQVTGNTAGESIQCKENDPVFIGGPNVAPKKEGLCF
jgi:hypothetical protein